MINFLEYWELEKLLNCSHIKHYRLKAMMALMAYAGLRVSEVRKLRLMDVMTYGEIATAISLQSSKTSKSRTDYIPIPPQLRDILYQWVFRHSNLSADSYYLFPNPKGRPYTSRIIQKDIRRVGELCLKRHITPHTLRHTFGTLLARKAPLRVVQEALRHRSVTSTQIYTHVTKTDLHKAVEKTFRGV